MGYGLFALGSPARHSLPSKLSCRREPRQRSHVHLHLDPARSDLRNMTPRQWCSAAQSTETVESCSSWPQHAMIRYVGQITNVRVWFDATSPEDNAFLMPQSPSLFLLVLRRSACRRFHSSGRLIPWNRKWQPSGVRFKTCPWQHREGN